MCIHIYIYIYIYIYIHIKIYTHIHIFDDDDYLTYNTQQVTYSYNMTAPAGKPSGIP